MIEVIAKRMAEMTAAINSQADAINALGAIVGLEWDQEAKKWKPIGADTTPSQS